MEAACLDAACLGAVFLGLAVFGVASRAATFLAVAVFGVATFGVAVLGVALLGAASFGAGVGASSISTSTETDAWTALPRDMLRSLSADGPTDSCFSARPAAWTVSWMASWIMLCSWPSTSTAVSLPGSASPFTAPATDEPSTSSIDLFCPATTFRDGLGGASTSFGWPLKTPAILLPRDPNSDADGVLGTFSSTATWRLATTVSSMGASMFAMGAMGAIGATGAPPLECREVERCSARARASLEGGESIKAMVRVCGAVCGTADDATDVSWPPGLKRFAGLVDCDAAGVLGVPKRTLGFMAAVGTVGGVSRLDAMGVDGRRQGVSRGVLWCC